MFGDFVEACYPFIVPGMSAAYCPPVRVAVQLSCMVAGAILGMSWGVDLTRFVLLSSSSSDSNFFCENASSSSSSYMSVTLLSGNGWAHDAVLGGPVRSSAYFPLPFSLVVSFFSDSIAAVCRLAAAAAVTFFVPFIAAFIMLRSQTTEL